MFNQRVKKQISLFLLALMSIGLIVTTLHSHHPFHWNLPRHLPNTGNNLATDAAFCPICGYTFKGTNTPVFQVAQVFESFITIPRAEDHIQAAIFYTPDRGRAPPPIPA
ncbi:MAG TPA: hypothetical protein VJ964_12810 [Balneolaceae bacterium]|nr:hypothetical protein [Balneolaceae bacterium]